MEHKAENNINKNLVFMAIFLAILTVIWLVVNHSIGNPNFKINMWNPEKAVADFGKYIGAWSTSWMEPGVVQKTTAYFIYEMVKLPIILGVTTYILSVIRLSIPTRYLKNSIGDDGIVGQSKGFLLGMVTPVCSCVVAPIYAGLIQGGASTKSSAVFLFAAPSMNVFAIAVMAYIGGVPLVATYLVIGFVGALLVAQLAGWIGVTRERLNTEVVKCFDCEVKTNVFLQAFRETRHLMAKLLVALTLTGLFAALLFHFNAVPIELLKSAAYSWYAPLIALIGVPLDVNAASSLALMAGVFGSVATGTLVAWMLAATLTSIPQMFILAKMYDKMTAIRLISFYTVFVAVAGLGLNLVLG